MTAGALSMLKSLDRLLNPSTLAVIGGDAARRVAEQCDQAGFKGEIWPVHPSRSHVAGRAAYASVEALPAAPDAAFLGVNRQAAIGCVAALSERGAGGAVCYASGFLEAADGDALQSELIAAAGDMPIVGPNCYGLINYLDGIPIWPDQQGGNVLGKEGRGVAIVTQSSNIAISMTMQRRGLPIAYLVTAGNQAQLGIDALARALLRDARVSAIGLHIEGFDSVSGLHDLAAEARRRGVPVVVLKAGRSAQAQAAALSHTAAIASSDAGTEALLRLLGFGRVHGIAEFLEALKLLHVHGALHGARIGSMSCSGGEASLMADAVADAGLTLPPLDAERTQELAALMHPLVRIANPFDYHTFAWGDEPALRRIFTAFTAADFDASALVLDFPRADRCDGGDWQTTLDAFHSAVSANAAKGVVVATMSDNLPEKKAAWMIERGIAPLGGLREALAALRCAADIGAAWDKPLPAPPLANEPSSGACVSLDEAESKARLAAFGVEVPAGAVADSAAAAGALSRSLTGTVVAKALGIAHKTERDAVRLNLPDSAAVEQAATDLLRLSDRLLVERLVEDIVVELIVGVHRDPALGLLLTVGSGGVFVELAGDAATLMLPVREAEVREALASLRCTPLLHGYRGRQPAALEAAIGAILAVADFAIAHCATLQELDVNPLAVTPQRAVALDALVRIRDADAPSAAAPTFATENE